MSPYLLLGFFLAGVLHAFVPGGYYTRYLSRPTMGSVVNAALFGIPLPLCSCGVIPTAMSLRKDGASRGAVASFLIATPQTGVDSIIATFSLMGLPFAVVRPLAALITAIIGGAVVNRFGTTTDERATQDDTTVTTGHDGGCGCGCGCHDEGQAQKRRGFMARMGEALHYAFVEMMEDIGKWLVVGLVVAGLITVFVPESVFAVFKDNTMASMLLVLCISVPMYLCATGSIPIAVALMLKGVTPGAALVLLMAGPACNMASILVIRKVMGMRTLVTYLLSIVVGAVTFGCIIDALQMSGTIDFLSALTATADCCDESTSWLSWLCTGILTALLIYALVLPRLGLRKTHACHCGGDSCHDDDHDHETCHTHQHHDTCHDDTCTCHDDGHKGEDDRCTCHDNHCTCHDDDDTSVCHCHGQQPEATVVTTRTYRIKGMNCNHCRSAAQGALESLTGVDEVTVTLTPPEAHIKGTATAEAVAQALAQLGFSIES